MRTLIIYCSQHHGNTKKLLDRLAAEFGVELLDATKCKSADLSGYDCIGFASGIFFSSFHRGVIDFAEHNLPEGKRVFFLFTCGSKRKNYTEAIRSVTDAKNGEFLGEYGCRGFDTYGPFKLVGGIAKGHPDESDISGAVDFFKKISM